jgi:hypothetical protein
MEEREAGRIESVVAGQLSGPADVAGEHAGPLHRGKVTLEGRRDGLVEVALAQADAQLATEDGDHVARAQGIGPA